jgi:cytochrome c
LAASPRKNLSAAAAPNDLAQRSGCLACHGIDRRVIGPAFRDVAARYKDQPGAAAQLLEKLRRGGSGDWGATPMPAQAQLPDADAHALVRWILSPGL